MKCKITVRQVTLSWSLFLVALLSLSVPQQPVEAANILGLFSGAQQSLLIRHMSIMTALAERGHNVTVVSSMVPKVMHESIELIVIPPTEENDSEMNDIMASVTRNDHTIVEMLGLIYRFVTTSMDIQFDLLNDPRFSALYDLPRRPQFDVVLVGFLINDYQLGMGAKFDCPVILHYPEEGNEWVNWYIGNPVESGYVPSVNVIIKPGGRMTFLERTANFLITKLTKVFKCFIGLRMENYYKRLFPSANFPSYSEAKKNLSLVFTDSHFTEGQIFAQVPALVDIGGIQVKDTPADLPQDIAEFLAASKGNGAVLFCLGADINTSNAKPETVGAIYNVLSQLKQNVIWKWNDLDNTPGNSSNILYKQWVPQDDILAHPNLRLLITHAGKGSVSEALHHGVPMVALPVFADQFRHAAKIAAFGYGRELPLSHIRQRDFQDAVAGVLRDPTYANNVRDFSKLYRDRPLSARESAVYWTEYVIRHRGAAHMQSPLVHMNSIQAANWDVFAFVGVVLYIAFRLIKLLCGALRCLVCQKCTGSPTPKAKKQ